MRKFEKVFLRIISYIGVFFMGYGFVYGAEHCFDKMVSVILILGAILFSCGFIGGKESIPEDEK